MDKTLKRTIGYRPEKKGPSSKTVPPKMKGSSEVILKPIKPTLKKEAQRDVAPNKSPVTAKEVCDWLKSHEYLSISPLCKAVGLDPGNFHRTMASENPVIKPEIIDKLVNILGQYGFLKK